MDSNLIQQCRELRFAHCARGYVLSKAPTDIKCVEGRAVHCTLKVNLKPRNGPISPEMVLVLSRPSDH